VVFREADAPGWRRYGLTARGSTDGMRFLGGRMPRRGEVPQRFNGAVLREGKEREEGVRRKQAVQGSREKRYDQADTEWGRVWRPECTIHPAGDLRTSRPTGGDPDGPLAWRPRRRGMADLHRRAEVSQQAKERYLDALASVEESATMAELAEALTRPIQGNGKRVRALRPLEANHSAWLEAAGRGEFVRNGLRNRGLQRRLFDTAPRLPRKPNGDLPASADSSGCYALTASYKRSHALTGTRSPPMDGKQSPRFSPPAKPPLLSSLRQHENRRSRKRFSLLTPVLI
jgi:hypothetical protein